MNIYEWKELQINQSNRESRAVDQKTVLKIMYMEHLIQIIMFSIESIMMESSLKEGIKIWRLAIFILKINWKSFKIQNEKQKYNSWVFDYNRI